MPSLPVISGRACVKALARLGYSISRQRGSHVRLAAPNRTPVTVPLHKELDRGTLRSILKSVEIDAEDPPSEHFRITVPGQQRITYNDLVTSTAKKILQEALALPDEERRRIGEAILDSIPPEFSNETRRAWIEEARNRAEALERGEGARLDLDEALTDLRSDLRNLPG